MNPARIVLVVALTLVFGGWAGESSPARASKVERSCPVSLPRRSTPSADAGFTATAFNYGNASLRVSLWPKGKLVAGPLPDGAIWASIEPDGSIVAKLGWWRGVAGKLVIGGRRLDASAPPLRAHVPDGYGATGFQATGITFSTAGCWKVTGRVGSASLAFVVLVVKREVVP